MKPLLPILILGFAGVWLVPLAAQPLPAVWFEDAGAEFHGWADFTGNGFADAVVVDKETGALRVGYQTSEGVFNWVDPRSSGAAGITGVTAGRLQTMLRDSLALTGPEFNRIVLLPLNSTAQSVPQSVHLPAVGPTALAAGQLTGTSPPEDLLVVSTLNNAPNNHRLAFYRNSLPDFPQQAVKASTPHPFDSLNRVILKTGFGPTLAVLERMPAMATFRVYHLGAAGLPEVFTIPSLPAATRYVGGPTTASGLAFFIFYTPGNSNFRIFPVQEPVPGTFTFGTATAVNASGPLHRLSLVTAGAGEFRLIELLETGEAVVRSISGTTVGPILQQFIPPPGQAYASALPVGGGTLHLVKVGLPGFEADGIVAGRSTGVDTRRHNNGTGVFDSIDTAQWIPAPSSRTRGNVLVFAGEPFANPAARILARHSAGEWSSGDPNQPGGNVTATGSFFQGPQAGIGGPVNYAYGAKPPGTTHALFNQYRSDISLAPLDPGWGSEVPMVSISPAPGLYRTSVAVEFAIPPGADLLWRRGPGAPWLPFIAPGPQPDPEDPQYPVWLSRHLERIVYKETVVEWFTAVGMAASPIQQAHYRFTEPADTLSSLRDGVPDYAKIGLGHDPFQAIPADGATNTGNSLQRLLEGAGLPPEKLSDAGVRVYVRPLSHDGDNNEATASLLPGDLLPDTTPNPGNQIFARDVAGSLIDVGTPDPMLPDEEAGVRQHSFFPQPSAQLVHLGSLGARSLAVFSTRPAFALDAPFPPPEEEPFIGREIIGVFTMPRPESAPFVRPYGGTGVIPEAQHWRNEAIGYYQALEVMEMGYTLDSLESVVTLLVERFLQQTLLERGVLPPAYAPTAGALNAFRFTITPGRSADSAAVPVAFAGDPETPLVYAEMDDLSDLEAPVAGGSTAHPFYRLDAAVETIRDTLRTSADTDIMNLRRVALDVHRISARFNNTYTGAFLPPFDALRRFIHAGVLPPSYTNDWPGGAPETITELTPATYASAAVGIGKVLAAVQPRTVVERDLIVPAGAETATCTVLLDAHTANPVALLEEDGSPFALPLSPPVLAGTVVRVTGFTDLSGTCAPETIVVLRLDSGVAGEIVSFPGIIETDTDGNLLGDEWEELFLGGLDNDPFAEPFNNGYSLLQLFLDGADPFFPASWTEPPAFLAVPEVEIQLSGSGANYNLMYSFPVQYAPMLDFGLFQAPAPTGPWTNAPAVVHYLGDDEWLIEVPDPGSLKEFWMVGLSLK
ncbi:MAG: hypothetical protein EA425_07915 [Puniceicoccaceae bacterium]|nr:MAG: hypothetical protein EA425_07915 [Puniceicoccaceae bacterium]